MDVIYRRVDDDFRIVVLRRIRFWACRTFSMRIEREM